MKSYSEWLNEHDEYKEHGLKNDAAGGIIPQKMDKAKKIDLITLPKDVQGTNCGNCKWVHLEKGVGMCKHPEVQQYVNARNCCAAWDNKGVKRPWKK